MARFKPSAPFTTPAALQNVTYEAIQGVRTKEYGPGELIYINFKTYGGTETTVNGLVAVEHTAVVETWYRPDILSSSRLTIAGRKFEILGAPEDIELRHQYLRFKVKEIKGGA